MSQEKHSLFQARDLGGKRKNMSWWVAIVKSEQQHKNINTSALKRFYSTIIGIQQKEKKKPITLWSNK